MNIANLFKEQGKYDDALPLYERALKGREKEMGPTNPDTLLTVANLGLFYENQRKYAEAEPLFRRALRGMETQLGPTHPSTLRSLNDLARLLEAQGGEEREEEAKALRAKAGR